MTTLNPLSTKPYPPLPKAFAAVFLALAFLGFLDATYLTVSHYQNALVPCPLTGQCETVLKSSYASVGPIPVALFGALYYLTLLILTLVYLDTKRDWAMRLAVNLTWAGILASLVLVALQLFIIHAICIYCMGSAATSIMLFVLGLIIRRRIQ